MSLLPPAAGLSQFTRSSILSRYSTTLRTTFRLLHTRSTTMARQFFVGGNFKMNPASRDAKRKLIDALNQASLDPSVGEQMSSMYLKD